jgi:hypothetical protein
MQFLYYLEKLTFQDENLKKQWTKTAVTCNNLPPPLFIEIQMKTISCQMAV